MRQFIPKQMIARDLSIVSYGAALWIPSALIWLRAVEKEPSPLGPGLHLAAVALVIAWSHFLIWIFRGMRENRISNGHCAILFFGAWITFFLVYNCLL
jgi:hypothetical protein